MSKWNTNKIWIKLNNNTSNPSKWIEQGYIELKDNRPGANSSDFNWSENPTSYYNFISKLKPGGTIYIYIVLDNKCLLKYKLIINSVYKQKFHGYLIRAIYECLDTIGLLEWHDGSNRNNRTHYAGRCKPGSKIYDKASNPKVRWDCIRSSSLHDQETTYYNNEIIDHKTREGELVQRSILIHNRSQKIKDVYLEKYGYSCKLCGKSYLKANGKDYIIEVHHLNPIKNGERNTDDIDNDLRGLCPNCHEFVHSIDDFENKTWGEIEKIFKEINKV